MQLLHAERCQIQIFQKSGRHADCVDDFFPSGDGLYDIVLSDSCFSNDFPSHDEDVRPEGLLSEPLLVSLGGFQGCALGLGTFYPQPSSNVAITFGISDMLNSIFLIQFRMLEDSRFLRL